MSLLLNLLFEQIANSNAYLLAKIGVDTAENEPLKVWGENSIQYSLHSLTASGARCRGCTMDGRELSYAFLATPFFFFATPFKPSTNKKEGSAA